MFFLINLKFHVMKRFLLLNIVLLIFVLTLEVKTQPPASDCYTTGPGCTETTKYSEVEVYPGCYIWAKYTIIKCTGSNEIQVKFESFGFDFTPYNPCLPFYNTLFPFYPNRNVVDDAYWNLTIESIKNEILNDLVDNHANSSTNGKADYLCGQNNFVAVTMYSKTCEAWCFKDAKLVTDPISGEPILPPFWSLSNFNESSIMVVAQQVSCNDVCCRLEREYCYTTTIIDGQVHYIRQMSEVKIPLGPIVSCENLEGGACNLPEGFDEYTPLPGQIPVYYYETDCDDTCGGE